MPALTIVTASPSAWARAWATARPFARPMPRRGAWYPVVGETSGDRAVIQINGRKVAIAKRFLELRQERPRTFTAVIRGINEPNPTRGTKRDLGQTYAVCPQCAARNAVSPKAPVLSCAGCHHRGEVAWWESG